MKNANTGRHAPTEPKPRGGMIKRGNGDSHSRGAGGIFEVQLQRRPHAPRQAGQRSLGAFAGRFLFGEINDAIDSPACFSDARANAAQEVRLRLFRCSREHDRSALQAQVRKPRGPRIGYHDVGVIELCRRCIHDGRRCRRRAALVFARQGFERVRSPRVDRRAPRPCQRVACPGHLSTRGCALANQCGIFARHHSARSREGCVGPCPITRACILGYLWSKRNAALGLSS